MSDPIPAATLILARDTLGSPDLLFVERAAGLAFAGGAVVFPGGRVDAGDHAVAADERLVTRAPDEAEDAAARVAAIRETVEEAGIAAGFVAPPGDAALAALRQGLHAGEPFHALLAAGGHRLDLGQLLPWARWRPNFRETRTFDTRFYVAPAPPDAGEPATDAGETVKAYWSSAAAVLGRADAGGAPVIFPTRRNLERAANAGDVAGLLAHARAVEVRLIVPEVREIDGVAHLTIPDDQGYPVTAEPMSRVRRG